MTATDLDGIYNFRDVGGLPAGSSRVRPGILFRSDALSNLTPAGVEMLARTSIDTIVDLRTHDEVERNPDLVPGSREFRMLHLPLLEGAHRDTSDRMPTLSGLYQGMAEKHGDVFVTIAREVATERDGARGGVLVHCAAGKDRTGVSVALVLRAVGVDRDAVVQDYVLTGERLAGEWTETMLDRVRAYGLAVTPELQTLLAESPAEAIEAVLDWIDDNHGDAAGYLLAHGLTSDELDALRARLIQD